MRRPLLGLVSAQEVSQSLHNTPGITKPTVTDSRMLQVEECKLYVEHTTYHHRGGQYTLKAVTNQAPDWGMKPLRCPADAPVCRQSADGWHAAAQTAFVTVALHKIAMR
jgi:hypothetical protein